jgi:MFS family permease
MSDTAGDDLRMDAARLARARWGTTITFGLAAAISAVWIVRMPALVDRLHLDASAVGVVVLCWGAGALLTMQLSRRLLVRVGTRTALRWSAPASTVTLALVGVANSYPALLIGAAIFGMAFGVLDIAMNTQAAAIERAYERHLMNGMHAGWSVGAVVGGIAGSLCAAAGVSFRATVVGAAIVATPVAIALGSTYLTEREEAHDEPPATGRLPGVVYLVGAIAFAAFMVEGSVADWSGIHLHEDLHASEAFAALGYPAFEAGALVGRLFGDRVRTAVGTRRLITLSGLLAAASFAFALLARMPWPSVIGFLLVGLTISPIVPITFSVAGDIDPPRAAAAIAVTGTLGYTGLLLGPVAIGLVADATTLRGALVIAVVLGVLIAIGGQALPAQWRRRPHDRARAATRSG